MSEEDTFKALTRPSIFEILKMDEWNRLENDLNTDVDDLNKFYGSIGWSLDEFEEVYKKHFPEGWQADRP